MTAFPRLSNYRATLKNWSAKLSEFSTQLSIIFNKNNEIKIDRDVEIINKDKGIVLVSPNNVRWRVIVDNSGSLNTESLE